MVERGHECAVSAGAYTAGVIDFLFQALQAWEEERERGAPQHRVQIRTLAGASAGAVAAMALVTAGQSLVADAKLAAATHLDASFIVSVVEALSRADPAYPFHIVRNGDQNMLQMHVPTGIRVLPWIRSWYD